MSANVVRRAKTGGKLTLTRETVRDLRVQTRLRTGAQIASGGSVCPGCLDPKTLPDPVGPSGQTDSVGPCSIGICNAGRNGQLNPGGPDGRAGIKLA